jgi:2-oxoisovalerate dehydrogenase E1 component
MPKSIIIDPVQVRRSSFLKIRRIPLNQYKATAEEETKRYGKETLKRIYRDMRLIREFETALHEIKMRGSYGGIEYQHRGPAHLSIGQEAAAVGQCVPLEPQDLIFGSHRSHGEILGKCLSATYKLEEARLSSIMETYREGSLLKAVEGGSHSSAQELAIDYILYGVLSEIFAKDTGINRGMGGSMHAFFAPFGSMPNNAIVGGSADIATGAALFKRVNRRPGIVIANIGDASSACGPTWEAVMLASMEQYRTLWDEDIGGAPPILFCFINNFYGMGGQTSGETMGFEVLARIGAGVNPAGMHAERVDGYNPLAVADALERKKRLLLEGEGPALLDIITYRLSGHSPSDASSYRTKEEIALWQENDCVGSFGNHLAENGHIDPEELEEVGRLVEELMRKALEKAASPDLSPRISLSSELIGELMFSDRRTERMRDGTTETLLPLEENPRRKAISQKSRFALDEGGNLLPKSRVISFRDALFEALLHGFYTDPTMIAFGEENRDWGGAFAVYRGLTESLPYHRLFNTPITEGAIVGAAVGYALSGGRVVAELMYCDFMGRAGDEIFNQMAKWQAMSGGLLTMPMVLRVSVGNKYGAQHSQDWSSLVAHIPGLKVMFPATPYDAKGMLNAALTGTDPVVFFESQRLYDMGELFVSEGVPREYYEVKPGQPAIKRSGKDLTLVTVGATLYRALEAADFLETEYGLTSELIDARFINPLDYEKILESVKKTGKVVLASDACERGSYLHTMASNITAAVFDWMDGPAVVVGSRNWITPAAELEDLFFPQKEWIVDAIHEQLYPLPGYSPQTNQSVEERLRRQRLGI